jgi:hypothetical protein
LGHSGGDNRRESKVNCEWSPICLLLFRIEEVGNIFPFTPTPPAKGEGRGDMKDEIRKIVFSAV